MADRAAAAAPARARSRNPLPEGTLAVGVGLLVSGVTAYAFLAVSARALGEERYAPLAQLWAMAFLLGPGFFLPVEQEVSRALAHRRARGLGGKPLLRQAALLAGGILGVLLVGVGIGSPVLLDKLFDGEPLMVVGLTLGLVGAAAGHFARGTCSGQGRFLPYAVFLGADGLVRLLICIGLVVAGVETVGPFGLAFGFAPIIAVVIAVGRERGLVVEGPPASWGEVSGALAALLAGSILSFTLMNGGPLVIDLFGSDAEEAAAGVFLNGLLVARVPLFLFQAVQAALLPRLSALAAAARFEEFRVGLRNLLAVTVAIGILATAGAFAFGPFVVRTMFGPDFDLDHRTLGLLALSCAVYMLALALAQAVIALGGHKLAALSWGAGVAAFGLVTTLGADELFLRVEAGLVSGSTTAAVCMVWALRSRLNAGAQPETGSVIEALHVPLEP